MAGLTRGTVCSINLGPARGRAQAGRRYAVVVQNPELWALSTVVVVPTSTAARPASFRPAIVVGGEQTRVLCEQVRTVDAQRLGAAVGSVSLDELRAIDDALSVVLDL